MKILICIVLIDLITLTVFGQDVKINNNLKYLKIDSQSISDFCKVIISQKNEEEASSYVIEIEIAKGLNFDADSGIVLSLVNNNETVLQSTLSKSNYDGNLVTTILAEKELMESMELDAIFFKGKSKYMMKITFIEDNKRGSKPVISIIKVIE